VKNEMATEKVLKAITSIIEDKLTVLEIIDSTDRLYLEIGSKYNGISFKLWVITEEGQHNQLYLGRYLGMTKKEADLSLCAIRDTLTEVIRNQQN
jgi:hypothetical protein